MSFIEKLKENNKILLEKYEGEDLKVDESYNSDQYKDNQDYIKICFLDLETTGTDRQEDEIVEIAMKVIQINKVTGEECTVVDTYESLNKPETPIREEISKINGITNEMLEGKSIDWSQVDNILSISDLAVAHNSYFDRPFLDRYLNKHIPWACSLHDIDWLERGFVSSKLELLSIWHGFFYDAHRAMNDVDALIRLLLHENQQKKPVIELIGNARKPYLKLILSFAYDESLVKSVKKIGGFRYHAPDKSWWKIYHDQETIQKETGHLSDSINARIDELSSFHKFKSV